MAADEWDDDVTKTASVEEAAKPHGKHACLTVLTGASTGELFKLASGTSVIGRGQGCAVRITDDGLSRQHAHVRLHGDALWIEDLGSTNGTFVNGERISSATPLHDGDKIQCGGMAVLRFAYHDELDESFHETLMSSALRDPLTNLFNKRYFLDRLDSELKFAHRHQTSVSLIMLDLDHFKAINDTHGHLAGDAVLANLAGVLSRAVRNEDVIARIGGEELAIILRAIDLELAVQLGDRLRRLVEQTTTLHNDKALRATVSIGVAGYPSIETDAVEPLLEAADQALYRAKHGGRNRVAR